MKLLSPVTQRSEPPSSSVAHAMLDMVSSSSSYISLSAQLKVALLKRTQDLLLDVWEWQELVKEYVHLKKRYQQYYFSYACFEALILEQIENSIKNQWQWTVQRGEDKKNPWILTFTNPEHLLEFLMWLSWFEELCNEQMDLLLQTTRSSSIQLLFDMKRNEQTNEYIYEYQLFILLDRGVQYKQSMIQLRLSDPVPDLQHLYTLFMQFLPEGVHIAEGLSRVHNHQLISKEQFDKRVSDDEQNAYAQSFDPQLWVLLDTYRDNTVSQGDKEIIFHTICRNEWWCFFVKHTSTLFTFSALESMIYNRPMDTFRLFAPDYDDQKAMMTFTGQQRNNQLQEQIMVLNRFFENKIIWRKVNKLPYKTICLAIAWEIIDNDTVAISLTFWPKTLAVNKGFEWYNKQFTLDDFYQLLSALQVSDLAWESVHWWYLWYEAGDGNYEWPSDEDFDDYKY